MSTNKPAAAQAAPNSAEPAASSLDQDALNLSLKCQVIKAVSTPCRCFGCDPFGHLTANHDPQSFEDLLIEGRAEFDRQRAKDLEELKRACKWHQYPRRVGDIDLSGDIDNIRAALAFDGFSPTCPEYRRLVYLVADDSFESQVALSRVKTFERDEAARSAPRRKSKGASKPAPKPRRSEGRLFEPSDFLPTREALEAECRRRKFMNGPDRINKAQVDLVNSIIRSTNGDDSQ